MQLVPDHRLPILGPDVDLPAAAHPAHVHHALLAVEFDPRGVLRPIGEDVAVANAVVAFEHVGRIERLLVGHQQVGELERGHLRVGRFGGPLRVEEPAHAIDAARIIDAAEPAGQIELMDSLIGHLAARVVPELAPLGMDRLVVLALRGRSVPHVPVQRGGRVRVRFPLEVGLVTLLMHAAEMDAAQLSLFEVTLGSDVVRGTAVLRADLDDAVVLASGRDGLAAFPAIVTLRLLAIDVLAGAAAQNRRQGVPVRRGGDHRGVDRSVGEHLAKVLNALGPLAPLARRVRLRSGFVQPAVYVANVADLAIVAIQKPQGQRVAPPSADADHRQHQPLVGRCRPHGSRIGENRQPRRQTDGGPGCPLQKITPIQGAHGASLLSGTNTSAPSHSRRSAMVYCSKRLARGVSFQLAVDGGTASWKLTPLISRTPLTSPPTAAGA